MGEFVLELLSTHSTLEESIMERTASAGFEGIAQMLLEQKKLMDALEKLAEFPDCPSSERSSDDSQWRL